MRRGLYAKLLLAFGLVLMLSLTVASSALAGSAGSLMQFGFRAAHGYRIKVEAHRSTIGLSVQRREPLGDARVSTTYYTRAKLSDDRIQASFGALGRIAMRFEPSGRIIRGGACSGTARNATRLGVFVGTLRFRGEGGYVSARINRAKGALSSAAAADCRREIAVPIGTQTDRHAKRTVLSVGFRRGLGAVYFGASSSYAQRARYSAVTESVEARVATIRFASVEASPLTFATDNALSFASLSPPYPFSGTGSLQRNPNGSRTWAGSLAVSFPGEPDLPLTGPQFRTRLTRSW